MDKRQVVRIFPSHSTSFPNQPTNKFQINHNHYHSSPREESNAGEEEEAEGGNDNDDDEEEDEMGMPMVEFIPKEKRDLLNKESAMVKRQLSGQQMDQEEEAEEEERKAQLREQRVKETAQMVHDILLKRQAEQEQQLDSIDREQDDNEAMPDDSDDVDPEGEFERWKQRELARLKSEREQARQEEEERVELERRRQMSDREVQEENRKLNIKQPKEKAKWNFLQKYYHAGAFYMEYDEHGKPLNDAMQRVNVNAPTGEDKVDRQMLPAVMQVKNFGKHSRSKWTHLTAEDTTNFKESPWGSKEASRREVDRLNKKQSLDRMVPVAKKRKI